MSNPREHKEFAPTAISVGGGGSPDQASPHTPGDNARNLGISTTAAFAERDGEDSLPDIVEPIYDSEEQERRVKMAVILAELDRLHAAATAGEWAAEYPINEQTAWIIEAQKPAYEWRLLAMVTEYDEEVSPNEGKANLDFILAAHNHYPALREEIRRLREEAAEHDASFGLYDACMRRATAYWQEKTGRKDTWPDTTALLKWLMDRIGQLCEENAALSQRLREQSARAGDEVHKLQAELATAKRDGAAEELRRLADEWAAEGLPGSLSIRDRAAKLEGK